MKKVLFLTNSLSAGVIERLISILITQLVKQNYEVELITLEKNDFYTLPRVQPKIKLKENYDV